MPNSLQVRITVNGQVITAHTPPETTLLQFLRDYLGLTGVKNGCANGHCGACTVILNGKAVRSCLVKMDKANQGEVITIEGLTQGNHPHPLQYTFSKDGAIQCGFCTPGMILSAKALLDANPDPSDQEIKDTLTRNHNLCRCTGYVNIITAIHEAAAMIQQQVTPPSFEELANYPPTTMLFSEALERATGKTQFGADLQMEGQLIGKILWAAHPRARILNIQTRFAESLAGVAAVLTAKDIPGVNAEGLMIQDQPVLAAEEVNYIGDAVAVVFAETEEIAKNALSMIEVEYEPLPPVLTPDEAAQPDAPQIHKGGNLAHKAEIIRGDVDMAFQNCALVIENDYYTPRVEHGFLEPESGIAFPGEDGGVTIQVGSQGIFDDLRQLVNILAMPEEKIRVVQLPMGGAFGGKEDMILQPLLALGALKTGRPVKIVLTREESLRVHAKRHPAWMHYKTGVNADGELVSFEAKIIADAGCYASETADVLENMATFAAGPYFVPNVHVKAEAWYTNNVPCGSMRGFGANQVTMASEQQMDEIARNLQMDPFELRLINGLDETHPTITNDLLSAHQATHKQTVEAARKSFSSLDLPQSTSTRKIGWGVACGHKNIGFGHGAIEKVEIILTLKSDGSLTLRESHHELGQGARATLGHLLSDEMHIQPEKIHIIGPDTALTPPTGTTSASRQTFLTGNAVVKGCRMLKDELIHRAADHSGADPSMLQFEGSAIRNRTTRQLIPLNELGSVFEIRSGYTSPKTVGLITNVDLDQEPRRMHWGYTFSTQVAVVEVDIESGNVRVLDIIAAIDVGKALNRPAVEAQIHGGVMMGLGYALNEEFLMDNGINQTNSLHKAHLPFAYQTPAIHTEILEIPHPDGPNGAKGFAEVPPLATAPAILNAITDAVGIRVTSLPANPQRILQLLNGRESDR